MLQVDGLQSFLEGKLDLESLKGGWEDEKGCLMKGGKSKVTKGKGFKKGYGAEGVKGVKSFPGVKGFSAPMYNGGVIFFEDGSWCGQAGMGSADELGEASPVGCKGKGKGKVLSDGKNKSWYRPPGFFPPYGTSVPPVCVLPYWSMPPGMVTLPPNTPTMPPGATATPWVTFAPGGVPPGMVPLSPGMVPSGGKALPSGMAQPPASGISSAQSQDTFAQDRTGEPRDNEREQTASMSVAEYQRQLYGEKVYAKVEPLAPNAQVAQKITGMLLGLPEEELTMMFKDEDELRARVDEAIDVLREDGMLE